MPENNVNKIIDKVESIIDDVHALTMSVQMDKQKSAQLELSVGRLDAAVSRLDGTIRDPEGIIQRLRTVEESNKRHEQDIKDLKDIYQAFLNKALYVMLAVAGVGVGAGGL